MWNKQFKSLLIYFTCQIFQLKKNHFLRQKEFKLLRVELESHLSREKCLASSQPIFKQMAAKVVKKSCKHSSCLPEPIHNEWERERERVIERERERVCVGGGGPMGRNE